MDMWSWGMSVLCMPVVAAAVSASASAASAAPPRYFDPRSVLLHGWWDGFTGVGLSHPWVHAASLLPNSPAYSCVCVCVCVPPHLYSACRLAYCLGQEGRFWVLPVRSMRRTGGARIHAQGQRQHLHSEPPCPLTPQPQGQGKRPCSGAGNPLSWSQAPGLLGRLVVAGRRAAVAGSQGQVLVEQRPSGSRRLVSGQQHACARAMGNARSVRRLVPVAPSLAQGLTGMLGHGGMRMHTATQSCTHTGTPIYHNTYALTGTPRGHITSLL